MSLRRTGAIVASRGELCERMGVARLIHFIERYVPRSDWDLRLWLAVLYRIDRYRFVWRRV